MAAKDVFKIGQTVKVYSVMNPRRNFKRDAVIKHIGPMHGGTEDMLWFEGGGSCWHPDACKAVKTLKESALEGEPGIFSPDAATEDLLKNTTNACGDRKKETL